MNTNKTYIENGWRCGDETHAEIVKFLRESCTGWLYKTKSDAGRTNDKAPIKTRITVTVTVEDV